jgi:hypothetical protein
MRAAPLNTGFLMISMIGFLISALYIPKFSMTWAFAFGLLFTLMFVASMIAMVHGTPDEQLSPRPRKIA